MIAISEVPTMPYRIAPLTFLYISTAVPSSPMIASHAVGVVSEPRPTRVASLATTMPADLKPRKARKAPMPAVIANFRLSGIALTMACRAPATLRMTNSAPEMNTAPSAVCHG